ncbi:hypothetical protein [Acetobacter senegalensis]|nr:hypothetical protein [Acetobacter senegalensis]
MKKAADLLQFEVGDKSIIGVDAAKNDGSVYRYQIRGIAAPDAYLIAAAPDLYDALSDTLKQGLSLDTIKKARSALARARGETP